MATKTKKDKKGKTKNKNKMAKSTAPAETKSVASEMNIVSNKGGKSSLTYVSVKDIVDPPKDLIVRDTNGDTAELAASIKKFGQLQSLLVRPAKKAGTYELLSGHRRMDAIRSLGNVKSVAVNIRHDLDDPLEALGAVMSENSPEGRSNLRPIEQARVFDRLMKKFGDDSGAAAKVAKYCGTTSENVRRTRGLLDAPKPVLEMLDADKISKDAVLAVQKISDDKTQKHVAKLIVEGEIETRADIERSAAEFIQDQEAAGKEVDKPKDGRKVASTARVWRSRREATAALDDLVWKYGVASGAIDDDTPDYKAIKDNEGAANALAYQIVSLLWIMGLIDKMDITTKVFKTVVGKEVERVVEMYGDAEATDEEPDAEAAEDKPSKKDKKGKKGKGKKSKKAEADEEEAPEDEAPEDEPSGDDDEEPTEPDPDDDDE